MLEVSLAEKDYESTLKWLTRMHDLFDIRRLDGRKMPGYADFANSPQYAEWQTIIKSGNSP